MNKLFFIIGLILMLASCRQMQHMVSTDTDSVRIERVTEYRDTLLQVPADSAWLLAWIECDSLGRAYLKQIDDYYVGTRSALPVVSILDNQLQVKCRCDSAAIYAKYAKIYDRTVEISRKKETVAVEVNRLTWWQNVRLKALSVVLVIAGVYIAFIILKRFLI